MKDRLGLYYYPSRQALDTRMYVRENAGGDVEYRLWNAREPELWERHEWITRDVVKAALPIFKARPGQAQDRNPLALYDEAVARRLIDEDRAGRG